MNIFITGGTSGIGKALVKLYLLDEHNNVGICGGTREEFERIWGDSNPRLQFFEVDVRVREELRTQINNFQNGDIDLLIASAGINQRGDNGPVPDFRLAEDVIDINFKGTLNTIEAVLPRMISKRQGHIVAIASGSGFAGFPGAAAYSSSKSAVITFMESFTIDMKQFGIDCTTICPGFVNTPLVKDNGRKMPFLIQPEEAAVKIKKAIQKKKELYTFPFIVSLVLNFIRILPRFLYRMIQKPSPISEGKWKENR